MAGELHPPLPDLWIVGAGRMGVALALLLHREGAVGELTLSGRRQEPPDHAIFRGAEPVVRYGVLPALPAPRPTAIVLAVPDAGIPGAARALAEAGVGEGTVVLHTSGALGSDALAPLAAAGCAVGSLHPLVAVAEPEAGSARLRGAWYALEAEGAARRVGERLVEAVGGRLLPVSGGAKPLYHAAAVVASNYVVALLGMAERLAAEAGVPAEAARAALAELAAGAVADVARAGPEGALTGPIARGDASTVRLHLERLSGEERGVYTVLAREALRLARRRGLDSAAAAELAELLREDP